MRDFTMRSLKQLSIRRCLEDEAESAKMIGEIEAKRVKFMDFIHQNPHKMVRKHGRGQRGCRTYCNVDFGYGRRYSVLALIALNGKGTLGLEGGIVGYAISAGNADADMTRSSQPPEDERVPVRSSSEPKTPAMGLMCHACESGLL